ncbi:MAG: hypothetical protein WCL39_15000, partial [Armatimonadota bacterium]
MFRLRSLFGGIKPSVALTIGVLGISMALTDAAVSRQKQRTVPGEAARESVYANIAGQFRTVFANLLWMKADG